MSNWSIMAHFDSSAINIAFNPFALSFLSCVGLQTRKNLEKNGIWTTNLTEEIPCLQEWKWPHAWNNSALTDFRLLTIEVCCVYKIQTISTLIPPCISPKTSHAFSISEREPYCRVLLQSVLPLRHKVWCWEQSSVAVLSWVLQTLSEVDVPHLTVFKPKCEQFLWGWHGSVEESLVEK